MLTKDERKKLRADIAILITLYACVDTLLNTCDELETENERLKEIINTDQG